MAFTEDQHRDRERTLERGPLTVLVDAGAAEYRIGLVGELDLSNVDLLDHELAEVERAGAAPILLDLSRLEFIDSVGISLLVRLALRDRENGARLRVLRPRGHVADLLALAGIDELLPYRD